jgi:Terpene cyclase DEP1
MMGLGQPVMHRFRPLFLLVAVLFTAYSTLVVAEHGYTGFLHLAWREPWAMQMLLDLTIALTIVSSLLVVDARRRKQVAWPWVVVTLFLGSVGPLWYLVLRRPLPENS